MYLGQQFSPFAKKAFKTLGKTPAVSMEIRIFFSNGNQFFLFYQILEKLHDVLESRVLTKNISLYQFKQVARDHDVQNTLIRIYQKLADHDF